MNIVLTVNIEAPDGATHYTGDLLDDPSWYKVTQVGVVGDHWWRWNTKKSEWLLSSHCNPHFLKELSEGLVISAGR